MEGHGAYYRRKSELIPAVLEAYESLAAEYDVIVIEGAGSPAEINLKDSDGFVNMGLARAGGRPGAAGGGHRPGRGVRPALRHGGPAGSRRSGPADQGSSSSTSSGGIRAILRAGPAGSWRRLCGVPVAGVVPYVHVDIDDEDSLTERFSAAGGAAGSSSTVAVIRLPRISNFTDFGPFERYENVSLRYVGKACGTWDQPDMILLPGTKSTIADLRWLRQSGLEAASPEGRRRRYAWFSASAAASRCWAAACPTRRGRRRNRGRRWPAWASWPVDTVFRGEKRPGPGQPGRFGPGGPGPLAGLAGHGATRATRSIWAGAARGRRHPGSRGCVYGSYIHGIFDAPGIADAAAGGPVSSEGKGLSPAGLDCLRSGGLQGASVRPAGRGGPGLGWTWSWSTGFWSGR